MENPETATPQMERARASFHSDARFRMLAQMAVARTMDANAAFLDSAEIEPRDVHEIAMSVAARLLQSVYEDDAEINRLRAERDHYRAMVEKLSVLTPLPPMVFLNSSREGE